MDCGLGNQNQPDRIVADFLVYFQTAHNILHRNPADYVEIHHRGFQHATAVNHDRGNVRDPRNRLFCHDRVRDCPVPPSVRCVNRRRWRSFHRKAVRERRLNALRLPDLVDISGARSEYRPDRKLGNHYLTNRTGHDVGHRSRTHLRWLWGIPLRKAQLRKRSPNLWHLSCDRQKTRASQDIGHHRISRGEDNPRGCLRPGNRLASS